MDKQIRRIGTNEEIVMLGTVEQPEAFFYVRYFEQRKIKEVNQLKNYDEVWTAVLPNGKTKTFLKSYLYVLFSD